MWNLISGQRDNFKNPWSRPCRVASSLYSVETLLSWSHCHKLLYHEFIVQINLLVWCIIGGWDLLVWQNIKEKSALWNMTFKLPIQMDVSYSDLHCILLMLTFLEELVGMDVPNVASKYEGWAITHCFSVSWNSLEKSVYSPSVCPRQVITLSYWTVRVLCHTDWLSFGLGVHLLFIHCLLILLTFMFFQLWLSVTVHIWFIVAGEAQGFSVKYHIFNSTKREGSENSML